MSSTKAKEMAAELGLQYYETSAATGQGVEEAVEALLTLVMARIERSLEEERRKVLSQQSQLTRKLSIRSVRKDVSFSFYGEKWEIRQKEG